MIDCRQFVGLRLHGGFIIKEIEFTDETLTDALERDAVATTWIIGREFRLRIRGGLSDDELSVTLYHEVLEATSVATVNPPSLVIDFNEAAFERSAREAHSRWGNASPKNLNLLLQIHGFQEE